ncbi:MULTISPECIES: hypothetical protein [unclassified Achromobacter]|uniref:hypothetical protein n=1 Tax=unclassified Achromobacter TaxID=2626865 RepID=UPI0006C00AA3|nr:MULTISPECIES: hypothetical protein [unclassified Achromobacter]KOF55305.1 hypothetical protein AD428_01515 [Achromobacter sp. DMS1]
MTSAPAAPDLPAEVRHLIEAFEAVPGISSVEIKRLYLPDLALSDLSLPGDYADLPTAALRRSGGGRPDETLLSIHFEISRNEAGLDGLEFLAWWTRDRARAGENVQLRAIALPPVAGGRKQWGTTLRFSLDWFYVDPAQDMAQLLKAMDEAAGSIGLFLDLYGEAFR